MLKSQGIIKVDPSNGRIVVDVSRDFIEYYNYFITREYWIKLHLPLHGSHITIANKKLHAGVKWDSAMKYHNRIVEFEYDEYLIRGGYTKGFIMFYIKVYSVMIDNMKKDLKIVERPDYRGLHITISNGKSGVSLYWPEMITL